MTQSWEEWLLGQLGMLYHPAQAWQAEEMGRQKPWEVQKREVHPALGEKQFHTSPYAEGHPAGKQLVRKGSGSPDKHKVGHEPVMCMLWQKGLPVSWFALSKVLSAGWWRCSFSSIQHWRCHTWNAWPSSGLPVTGKLWSYSKESSKGPLRWLRDKSILPMMKGWKSWDYEVWRRKA